MLRTRYKNMMKVPVKEEYYGASNHLEKALKALTPIVNRINSVSELELIKLNVNDTKENKMIEDAFRKEFGFARMNLFWENSSVPNAYTVTGGLLLNQNPGVQNVFKDEKDRYYDKRHQYLCSVAVIMTLVHNLQLTPRETMGIILHEIGHNFDNQISTIAWHMVLIATTFGKIELQRFLYPFVQDFLKQLQREFPELLFAIDFFKNIEYHLQILMFLKVLFRLPTNPLSIMRLICGTRMEFFADSFAAKYGFGPDLASATEKFKQKSKMGGYASRLVYSIPVIRTYADIVEGPVRFIASVLDVHPLDENRVIAIRHNLEQDYNDPNVPKALKPEIAKQIKQIDQIIEVSAKNTATDGYLFGALRKFLIYNTTGKLQKFIDQKK